MNPSQLTGSDLAITSDNGVIHALGLPLNLSFLKDEFASSGGILTGGGRGKKQHKKLAGRPHYDGMSIPAGLACTSHYEIMYNIDNIDNIDNYNDTPVIRDELYDTLLRLSEYKKDNHPHVLYDNAVLSQSPNNYEYDYYVATNDDNNTDNNKKTKRKPQTKHVKGPKRNTKKIKNKK